MNTSTQHTIQQKWRIQSRNTHRQLWILALLFILIPSCLASNNDDCQILVKPQQVDFDFTKQHWPLRPSLIPENAIVGDILIKRFPIFDIDNPKENNWLFRSANQLHISTAEKSLRVVLLFSSGETYQPRLLKESARILRNKTYLYDAKIFPYQLCDNRVDILVVTRDMWTLTPGIDISRSGGTSSSSFVLRDSNFLGLGKRVSVARRNSVDQDGWEFDYGDSNLFGSRYTLDLLYANNEDGARKRAALNRPFFSLDTRWSLGLLTDDIDRVDKLYLRGESIAQFRTHQEQHGIAAGLSSGWHDKRTQRWWIGFNRFAEHFSREPGKIAPSNFPVDRELNYVWFATQVIEDQFVTLHNINQIYRTEDINLGQRWQLRMGWADQAWGSDSNRLIYDYRYHNTWQLDNRKLFSYSFSLNGLWNQQLDNSEDVLLSQQWRYHYVNSRRTAHFAILSMDIARNLPNNKQLLLGGEQNLRGYPLRYQSGDRRVILTLEKRFYGSTQWFHLFRTGAAAFVDVGHAWFSGKESHASPGVLSNIGIGVRISSNRAEKTRILHIDFAVPLRREDDIDRFQLLITGKASF